MNWDCALRRRTRREEPLPVKTSVTVRTAKKAVEEPRASFTPSADASDACGSAGWNFFWQARGCGHQAGDDVRQEHSRIQTAAVVAAVSQ